MQWLMVRKKAFIFTCVTSLLSVRWFTVWLARSQSRSREMAALSPGTSHFVFSWHRTDTLWAKEVCGRKVICLVLFSFILVDLQTFFLVVYFFMDIWHVIIQIQGPWGAEHIL